MANHHCQDQNLRCITSFLIVVFLFLIEAPILAVAQPNQFKSFGRSVSRSIPALTTTTTTFTNLNNDDAYYNEAEANTENIYDDEEEGEGDFDIGPSAKTISPLKFNNSIATHIQDGAHEYDDEVNSEQDEYDDIKSYIFSDTISANRASSKQPQVDYDNTKTLEISSTSQVPFASSNLVRNLFSKPAILVGMIGGITIGMMSAILLVMFIVYRMRKKDEGSYALEEGPRKSPSHAYSRVSSKEFFA